MFFKIGFTSNEAMRDSFSLRFNGLIHVCPSYQPDSSYSTFSEVNLLKMWFHPRYSLIVSNKGIDKLLKRLINTYFKVAALKYVLPDEIKMNIKNETNQNLNKISAINFFDLAEEKNFDFDNSINSFVGCCSFGTGHFDLFIKIFLWKL